MSVLFVFFNDTATTEIYTLSLHDALPIYVYPVTAEFAAVHDGQQRVPGIVLVRIGPQDQLGHVGVQERACAIDPDRGRRDRKSTRLNSSHANISYAVFCLKKKKKEYR